MLRRRSALLVTLPSRCLSRKAGQAGRSIPKQAKPTSSAATSQKPADPSQSEWFYSEERAEEISRNEKTIAGIAVVTCALAIAGFTWTKWEVERRVQEELSEVHQKEWYEGTYQQNRLAEQRAKEAEIEGFEAMDKFAGAREGYVFKAGPVGLGYYPDLRNPAFAPK